MNPRLKTFLVVCGYALLVSLAIGAISLFLYLLESLFCYLLKVLVPFVDTLFAKTSSEVLIALCIVCIVCCVMPLIFSTKIISSYQSFKNENADGNIFSEVYNDPTIRLKDKALFFSIRLIYYIQLPLLYCALKISPLIKLLLGSHASRVIPFITIVLILINAILLIPVTLLELIKYPLVKLFSPLGLNVKQLSFLFNISDVGTSSQSVHTSSFEHSILQCAQELKQKFGAQPNVLNKEFEDYINNSDQLTTEQKEQLKLYLNFNGSNGAAYRESKLALLSRKLQI